MCPDSRPMTSGDRHQPPATQQGQVLTMDRMMDEPTDEVIKCYDETLQIVL